MTTSMKLFVLLWIIMVTRVAGALIGGRQCLRLRHLTKFRRLYEWLSAVGIGLILWGIADLGLIWNSVVNGPSNKDAFPTFTLWFSIGFQLLETLAVWMITLVILNGEAPGSLRKTIFRILETFNLMETNKEFHKSDILTEKPKEQNHDSGT